MDTNPILWFDQEFAPDGDLNDFVLDQDGAPIGGRATGFFDIGGDWVPLDNPYDPNFNFPQQEQSFYRPSSAPGSRVASRQGSQASDVEYQSEGEDVAMGPPSDMDNVLKTVVRWSEDRRTFVGAVVHFDEQNVWVRPIGTISGRRGYAPFPYTATKIIPQSGVKVYAQTLIINGNAVENPVRDAKYEARISELRASFDARRFTEPARGMVRSPLWVVQIAPDAQVLMFASAKNLENGVIKNAVELAFRSNEGEKWVARTSINVETEIDLMFVMDARNLNNPSTAKEKNFTARYVNGEWKNGTTGNDRVEISVIDFVESLNMDGTELREFVNEDARRWFEMFRNPVRGDMFQLKPPTQDPLRFTYTRGDDSTSFNVVDVLETSGLVGEDLGFDPDLGDDLSFSDMRPAEPAPGQGVVIEDAVQPAELDRRPPAQKGEVLRVGKMQAYGDLGYSVLSRQGTIPFGAHVVEGANFIFVGSNPPARDTVVTKEYVADARERGLFGESWTIIYFPPPDAVQPAVHASSSDTSAESPRYVQVWNPKRSNKGDAQTKSTRKGMKVGDRIFQHVLNPILFEITFDDFVLFGVIAGKNEDYKVDPFPPGWIGATDNDVDRVVDEDGGEEEGAEDSEEFAGDEVSEGENGDRPPTPERDLFQSEPSPAGTPPVPSDDLLASDDQGQTDDDGESLFNDDEDEGRAGGADRDEDDEPTESLFKSDEDEVREGGAGFDDVSAPIVFSEGEEDEQVGGDGDLFSEDEGEDRVGVAGDMGQESDPNQEEKARLKAENTELFQKADVWSDSLEKNMIPMFVKAHALYAELPTNDQIGRAFRETDDQIREIRSVISDLKEEQEKRMSLEELKKTNSVLRELPGLFDRVGDSISEYAKDVEDYYSAMVENVAKDRPELISSAIALSKEIRALHDLIETMRDRAASIPKELQNEITYVLFFDNLSDQFKNTEAPSKFTDLQNHMEELRVAVSKDREKLEKARTVAERLERWIDDEKEKLRKEAEEAERLETERRRREETLRLEKERKELEEAERLAKEEAERERVAAELEALRKEEERLEQEKRAQRLREETERLERRDAERREQERREQERLERQRAREAERAREEQVRQRLAEEQRRRDLQAAEDALNRAKVVESTTPDDAGRHTDSPFLGKSAKEVARKITYLPFPVTFSGIVELNGRRLVKGTVKSGRAQDPVSGERVPVLAFGTPPRTLPGHPPAHTNYTAMPSSMTRSVPEDSVLHVTFSRIGVSHDFTVNYTGLTAPGKVYEIDTPGGTVRVMMNVDGGNLLAVLVFFPSVRYMQYKSN